MSTGVLLVLYLVKAGMNYFMQYYGHIVGVNMQAQMRWDVPFAICKSCHFPILTITKPA